MKKFLILCILLSSGLLLSQKTKYYLTYTDNKGKGLIDTLGTVLLKSDYYDYIEIDYENDIILLRNKEGKFGILDASLKTIIPFKYDYISLPKYQNDRFIYSLQSKEGLLSFQNKKVSQLYRDIYELDKNYFRIRVNKKHGVIDKNDYIIINPEFDLIAGMSEKLIAAAVKKEGKYGYINLKGKWVISPQYDHVMPFKKGKAIIIKNKKQGVINKKGIVLIEPVYDEIWTDDGNLFFVKQNGKYGVFNQHLKMTLEPIYDYIKFFDTRDIKENYSVRKNKKYGFINKKGELIIDTKYVGGGNFSEGLAPVLLNRKWGFINKNGETIIDFQYDRAYDFSEGLASVLLNGKWGFINKKGETIIDFQFIGDVKSFHNGVAKYYKDTFSRQGYIWSKAGYIKKDGTIFIEPKYERIEYLYGNKAIEVYDGCKYLIDIKTGKRIFRLQQGDTVYMAR